MWNLRKLTIRSNPLFRVVRAKHTTALVLHRISAVFFHSGSDKISIKKPAKGDQSGGNKHYEQHKNFTG
jgi:hypothetical protein